jgi:hypothetical protein
MKMQPTAWFWIVAAAVLAVALFTVGPAHGQSTGAKAVFEGRPAMAGAQAGTGAMAGPPQGGVGPQSPEDPGAGVTFQRRAPTSTDPAVSAANAPAANGPSVPRDPGGVDRPAKDGVQPRNDGLQPQRDRDSGNVIKRERGQQDAAGGSTTKKAQRGAKRSIERARRGVSGVDS